MTGNTKSLSTTVTLNNGVEMPVLGLGVFLSPPALTASAVKAAIDTGYRLIDTAAAYKNERAVRDGLRASGIAREQVFITTKAFPSQYGYDETLTAFDDSLDRLGIDYLDLYLLLWPVPTDFGPTIEAYRAAEKLLARGRVRAIGVSNFEPDHLDRLIEATDIVPTVNQIELHPFFVQHAVRAANEKYGIVTEAWSPIGGVYGRNASATVPEGATSPLDHPVVVTLASKYDKTAAQVILRWHLQHDIVVIPKSVHAERIAENAGVFDFELTSDEVQQIDGLDTGVRAGSDPATFTKNSYPIDINDQ
jgi:diketogulonate reductase-like aldo/keto reductase